MSKALATKNVAAVLLSVAMVVTFAFAFATPVKAQSMADLQAQINALLAQIAALQGSTGSTGGASCATFTQNLRQGSTGGEVMAVQKFLNSSADTRVAATGAGSPGNETSTFGPATKAAVIKFQNKYAADILTPNGLTAGNGNWYASTRAKANALCVGTGTGTGTGTATGTATGGNVMIGAASQPANSLAPQGASRVPFTTFTLTNTSGAAVTINSVTVQKTGLGDKAVFDGIVLVDSNGMQLGNAKTMNSNNQAILDAGITLQAGQTVTLTVSGNMLTSGMSTYAGQIIGLSVVGVNTGATVSGSLPISGATHTINATLSLGGMTAAIGALDPNTSYNSSTAGKPIGTTGFTFASVRLTNTGSAEDQWIKSIRWNQSGSASASDIANVMTVVDGVNYPMTVSADGKYYTVVFPGQGLEIQKGLQKEFTVKADIVNGPARTISFDIYKASDIYVVGETFGYGIIATPSSTGSVTDATTFTTGTPFFSGSVVQVNAGTVSSVSRANEVGSQNVVELSPNQVLGGFAVDIKGEPITVASIVFGFTISGTEDATDLDNVTLVDENGVVVAGPVDGVTGTGTDGKVTFTDTVTFPTGRHVYTLKGQLSGDFSDGDTIVASTTPNSTYWTNVRGTITGNTVTLGSASDVTGNTMTVRAGGVALTIASAPSAQTIVSGGTGVTVSAINFDATQSGEDVRFMSAKFRYTESLTPVDDLTNCAAYDGATRLNSSSVELSLSDGSTPEDETFSFDTPLLVTKGTVKVVSIKCDIPASITGGTFSVGVTTAVNSGTGMTSSQTVTPSGATQAGNTMTISGAGALAVALDASSPSYRVASAGTTGVTLGALRFTATNENMRIERVALQMSNSLASSSPADLTQVTLWDGATQVGTALFAGSRFATSTLSSTVIVPANGSKVLTIKGDLGQVGTGQAMTESGHLIEVDYDGNDSTGTRGIGAQSNTTVNATGSDTDVAGVRIHRSVPTITYAATPGALTNGVNSLLTVTVTADAANDVQLYELTFNVATTSASVTSWTATGPNGSVGTVTTTDGTTIAIPFTASGNTADRLIPAGGSKTFTIGGTVSGLTGSTSGVVSLALAADTGTIGSMGQASAIASTSNIVWSPNSTSTPSSTTTNDWTNGYGLGGCFAQSGLGVSCFAATKAQQ